MAAEEGDPVLADGGPEVGVVDPETFLGCEAQHAELSLVEVSVLGTMALAAEILLRKGLESEGPLGAAHRLALRQWTGLVALLWLFKRPWLPGRAKGWKAA